MEINRGIFLIFFIFFMFFTPAGNPPRFLSHDERGVLTRFVARQRHQLSILANSTWDSGYGQLVGLKEYPEMPAQPGSILPAQVYNQARSLWTMEPSESGQDIGSLQNQLLVGEGDIAYYKNISGILRGQWEKMDLSLIPINMTIPEPGQGMKDPSNETKKLYEMSPPKHIYRNEMKVLDAEPVNTGNVSDGVGNIQLQLTEYPNRKFPDSNVSVVESTVELLDKQEEVSHNVKLRGLHIKSTGNIVLATTSFKFSGQYALPHLLLSSGMFEESQDIMVNRINTSLTMLEELTGSRGNLHDIDVGYEIYEDSVNAAEKCEYIIYGHVHSTGLSKDELEEVEDELKTPLGRPHKKVPYLRADAVLYSPDCGIALKTKETLEGERFEQYYKRVRQTVVMGIVLLLLQTVFMAIQMKDTNTPSTISRVSFYSIGLMSVLDGAICMTSLVSSFIEFVALPFMAVVFIAFALTSLFEMRYMVLIYRSQIYESVADARAREATRTSNGGQATFVARPDGTIVAPESNNNNSDQEQGLPTTETNTNTATQTPSPVDIDERQIMGMIYSRFYFTLLAFLIISLTAASWPPSLRKIYEYVAMFILYSLWLPQIYRNIARGSRRSFLWSFVIATSVIRVLPVLYICLNRHNVVQHRYDPVLACLILGWLWVQICVLAAQTVFGPRFFLPKSYQTTIYDYHPVITEDDLESGFNYTSLGESKSTEATTEEADNGQGPSSKAEDSLLHQDEHHPTVDCAICMMPVEMLVVPKGRVHIASTPANILARRRYMVTPCRHVFHTECMETWMRTRLQCPVCRNPLPPI